MKFTIVIICYIIICLIVLLLWYSHFKHAFPNAMKENKYRLPVILLPVILDLTPVLGAFLPKGAVARFFEKIGNFWYGYLLIGGMLLIASVIIQRIAFSESSNYRKRQGAIGFLAAVIVLTIGLSVAGAQNATNTKVVHYHVNIKDPAATDIRLAVISDLHIGVNSNIDTYRKMVSLINDYNVDAVLVCGDLLNDSYAGIKDPEAYEEVLSGMDSTYGTYFVYGNHDVERRLIGGFAMNGQTNPKRDPKLRTFIRNCGWTTLNDQVVRIQSGNIQIVGRRDAEYPVGNNGKRLSVKKLMKKTDSDHATIVMQHEPLELKELGKEGADLIVGGHTHNGQIFPGGYIAALFNDQVYGLRKKDSASSIVTSGVGWYGIPLRVGTNSEIAIVSVHFTR